MDDSESFNAPAAAPRTLVTDGLGGDAAPGAAPGAATDAVTSPARQSDPSAVDPPAPDTSPASSVATAPRAGLRGCAAAVDLGSNTFHLLVARIDGGEPRTIQRLGFRVRLAAGLDDEGGLTPEAWNEARDALLRIADRLGGVAQRQIRAVGTSALRSLIDPGPFLQMAGEILGVPVRIVSGSEEAHLVFAGATEPLPESAATRLVVDIGGGSTEFACGRGHAAEQVLSLPIGCVPASRRALASGRSGEAVLTAALADAREALRAPALDAFCCGPDVQAIGTSGTFESVRAVLAARGWSDGPVTRTALVRLVEALRRERQLPVPLPGLEEDKEDLFHGGLAILLAAMERLGLERMEWSEGALQDGLLRRIVPLPADGLRAATLRALRDRFVVDLDGAQRVRDVAMALLDVGGRALGIDPSDRAVLEAGALLHDVGMAVNAVHHERHGAWLLRNAELRGFAAEERLLLLYLVRGHRGAWPRLQQASLPGVLRRRAERLCVLLRLAVILGPVGTERLPAIGAGPEELRLAPDDQWRRVHPWVADRLRDECAALASLGVRPRVVLGRRVAANDT